MLFWPLVLLALVLLALVLGDSPDAGLLGTGGSGGRSLQAALLLAGLVVAVAGRVLLRGLARTARFAILLLGLVAVAMAGYGNRAELAAAYERLRGNIHPSVALATAEGEAMLRRAWDGHYRAEAQVNGVPMRLIVDTGASMVLLPYEEVRAVGIDPAALDFSMAVTTANGESTVAPVRLSSIKIGPIAVFDVPAAVARPGKLQTGLLGMSFIERLSETSFRGDTLILRN